MEVVNFCNSRFWEIPQEDNPAFGNEECYMVVKDGDNDFFTTILHIVPKDKPLEEETITYICKCWDVNKALEIAELLANS